MSNNCVICGTPLKLKEFWRNKCFDCYKKTELKNTGTIQEKMKRLGENTISGKKSWKQKIGFEKAEIDYKMGINRRKSWGRYKGNK